MIPSHTDIDRPSGQTSHSRTTQSVSGADDAPWSTARTSPATVSSRSSGALVYVSIRPSTGRWSHGPANSPTSRLGTGSSGSSSNGSAGSSAAGGSNVSPPLLSDASLRPAP